MTAPDTDKRRELIALLRGTRFEYLIDQVTARGLDSIPVEQRALVAAQIHRERFSRGPDLAITRRGMQELFGVGVGTFDRSKAVITYGIDELHAMVVRGQVHLTTAADMARLGTRAQQDFVEQVKAGVSPRVVGSAIRRGKPIPANQQQQYTNSTRDARYRYIQPSALRVLADSLTALATVMVSTEGLDPSISPTQAATWHSDLSRRAKAFRQILTLLKERSK